MNELVIVKQLPIIEEHLKGLAAEIDLKVETAMNLVCTEDTVKDVKKVRTDLNNQFKELETSRKSVKTAIMSPYEQFEKIYKECVSDKFKKADTDLKNKADEVENNLKAGKQKEVEEYFTELLTANEIDFVAYKHANINVTLTASMKSLKEQAKAFIEKIVSDLALIETQEHKDEILFEYKVNLDVSKAILTVSNRVKALEEQKAREEERKQREAERQAEKPIAHAPLQAPTVEPILETYLWKAPNEVAGEPKLTMSFEVKGTKAQLRSIKQFLIDNNIEYK